MSRRRYISTDVSVDRRVNALAKEGGDFAVMLYLLMIPHANDAGELTGDTEELLATVLPMRRDKDELDIENALALMDSLGLVSWNKEACTLCFPSETFYKYQTYIPEGKRKGAVITKNHQESPQNADERRKTPQNAAYPSPSPSPSPSPTPTPSPSPIPSPTNAAADPFDGGEKHQPKSVDLRAVLAIRPNWEAELNKRLSRKPAENPEGFKRWQVCRWLNGEESPPPIEKPKPKTPVYLDMAQFRPAGTVQ